MTAERWALLLLAGGLVVTWCALAATTRPGELERAAYAVGLKRKAAVGG